MEPLISKMVSGILTLTLNRSEVHNAFDEELIQKLTEELEQSDRAPAVRVVILAAQGRSFCAGADLKWMQRMAGYSKRENRRDAERLAKLMQVLKNLSKPTIACVQGDAYGGGVGLVACCDIVLAAPAVKFCLSEVKLGLVPAVVSPYVMAAMGERATQRYFLTAESFDAAQAQVLGLVHEITPLEQLYSYAHELAERLMANGPAAMAETKRLMQPIDAGVIKKTIKSIVKVRSSAEAKEGMQAFFEKRSPNWVKKDHV